MRAAILSIALRIVFGLLLAILLTYWFPVPDDSFTGGTVGDHAGH